MFKKHYLVVVITFLSALLTACNDDTRLPDRSGGGVACTMDVKVCPDGSAVSRNPANNCEFDPCSGGEVIGECKGDDPQGQGGCAPIIKLPPE